VCVCARVCIAFCACVHACRSVCGLETAFFSVLGQFLVSFCIHCLLLLRL
jgi:hypothetical protein